MKGRIIVNSQLDDCGHGKRRLLLENLVVTSPVRTLLAKRRITFNTKPIWPTLRNGKQFCGEEDILLRVQTTQTEKKLCM